MATLAYRLTILENKVKNNISQIFDLTNRITKLEVILPPVPADTLLIKTGQDRPNALFIQSNIANMETLPFDGVAFLINSSSEVQRQTLVPYSVFVSELAPIKDTTFTTLKHNFIEIFCTPAGDLFSDWTVPIQNWANLAAAAQDTNKVTGVFFDIEEYFGQSLNYPNNAVGKTLPVAQAQAQLRGEQIMSAMLKEWPTLKFMSTYGPWLSEKLTAINLSGVPYNDVSFANQLAGSFLIGCIKAIASVSTAQYIDGGEIYTARSSTQFETIKAWQKSGMANLSQLIPESLKIQYPSIVSSAFGVYDRSWIDVNMDVDIWATTLKNALTVSDKYVWAYTEEYDWWGTGWPTSRVPQSWIDATITAVNL